MGEKLFDDLARALVEPVPRSRALRLMGSILVATSLPGAAFARNRRPTRRTAFECKEEAGFGGQECCSGDICCGKKNCCSGGQRCDPDGKCISCPKPLKKCGPKCCPTKSKCCKRPRSELPPGWPERERYVCCYEPNECDDGVCGCPDGKGVCGKTCCKKGEHCSACLQSRFDSATEYAGRLKCCGKGTECCGSACIDRKRTCCYGKPCPASKPYCSETGTCCAEEQFAIQDDGTGICCPDGTVATPEGACAGP